MRNVNTDRRRLLQSLAVGLGVALSPACNSALEQGADLHKARNAASNALSESEQRLVARLCDLLLPATHTPGAADAGVADFVANLFSDWMNEAERAEFRAGLQQLEERASGGFVALEEQAQVRLLDAEFERIGADDALTLAEIAPGARPFLLQLRDLVVIGFYTSETGAKQALAYNPVPGFYDGAYPIEQVGTHWSY